jgi:hypothetical protein
MNAPVRIFATNAPEYADAGLPVFPVKTQLKKPAIRGWQDTTTSKTRSWASNERLGAEEGLGLLMGDRSRITEIDVDAVGEGWLGIAVEQFGETPIVIRTASGKAKLWYRYNGEGRHIRPFEAQPIDVLGKGFTIAPPSWREDLSASYRFETGSIADTEKLPAIRASVRADVSCIVGSVVNQGQRNNTLWRYCMAQARHCDDLESLIDVAATWTSAFPDPLTLKEVEKCARSAWRYETQGRNFVGLRKPQIIEGHVIMDTLLDQPEAFTLYQLFLRWHSNRRLFAISPRAMSESGSPPWPRGKIERARDVLLERGFIEEVLAPNAKRRTAGRYRLVRGYPGFGNNYYTPLFPLPQ